MPNALIIIANRAGGGNDKLGLSVKKYSFRTTFSTLHCLSLHGECQNGTVTIQYVCCVVVWRPFAEESPLN